MEAERDAWRATGVLVVVPRAPGAPCIFDETMRELGVYGEIA